jgi:response regulator NasT
LAGLIDRMVGMRIVVIDLQIERAEMIASSLREQGHSDIHVMAGTTERLLDRLSDIDPDAILIDMESPSRDELEQMFDLSRQARRPVAMFVGESGAESIAAAVEAGVGAYVVNGLKPERFRPVLDLAVSRFNAFARLQTELDMARAALTERKLIDRAKGILMKVKGVDEEEAYRILRTTAMNQNRKIAEIAESIVTAAELLN